MNIREKAAVLLQGNNSLLYQSFPSPSPKLMQLMMTSRSADFTCSSIRLRMKEGKNINIYTENHETSCKLHKRKGRERGERERELQLNQELLQNEEQGKGNKEERKGGESLKH